MKAAPDAAEFARSIAPAVWRAAEIAHALEGRVQNSPKSGEVTAVKQALTAADTAAQEAVLETLVDRFPTVSLAAEEDTPSVGRFPDHSDALVIVDPIDGTLRSYLERGGPYAVIVGLAWKRELQVAIVALPREGLLFHAVRGQGAFMSRARGEPKPARLAADGNRVLVSNGMPAVVSERLRELGFEVIQASGGAVSIAPLIPGVRAGLRLAGGARGISIRGRVGALIAAEAGALVRSEGGRLFPSDLDSVSHTLRVATNEEDLRLLDEGLAAAMPG
jgi:fructose-1,6-bisphosphatase/inositol monophosphatase family enzyme